MIHPARLVPAARSVPCALDRHLGPFAPLPELRGWLGTDWYGCGSCRSTVTRDTAFSRKCAA